MFTEHQYTDQQILYGIGDISAYLYGSIVLSICIIALLTHSTVLNTSENYEENEVQDKENFSKTGQKNRLGTIQKIFINHLAMSYFPHYLPTSIFISSI